jgi:hypothetical protein
MSLTWELGIRNPDRSCSVKPTTIMFRLPTLRRPRRVGHPQFGLFVKNARMGHPAEATASNESGDGELNLYSEVVYTCGESLFASSVSFIRFGTSFTWFRFASGTTFDKMTPCPEPGHTISCTRDHVVFADARDILGVYVEMTHPWVRVFGVLVCSPTWTIFNQQNIAPERPYCHDADFAISPVFMCLPSHVGSGSRPRRNQRKGLHPERAYNWAAGEME